MPTIDQLQAAVVASDDDLLPVCQSGIARRISRSQLLAGTQTSLSLTAGLLGRTLPGLGPPQQILVGSGLSLTNGTLSSLPRYSAATLPLSNSSNLADLVPIGRNGQDYAVTAETLLSTKGVDISGQIARASIGLQRKVSDWVGDAVAVEAFGATGDGVTDDTGALNAAIATGRPLLLGPKTYRVDGQWSIQAKAILLGTPGLTTLCRGSQLGGAWVSISGPSFVAVDVTFDAGSLPGDSWGVLLTPDCRSSAFRSCAFLNATGERLGTGLTIQGRDGSVGQGSSHSIIDCVFKGNACHGIWVQAACGVNIQGCTAADNGQFGICLDFNDPTFQQKVRQSSVVSCRSFNNIRGISVGNYNETNQEPPRWGLKNPDATDIIVSGNFCSGNAAYGIAASGERIKVDLNIIAVEGSETNASGILCNCSLSSIENNTIIGPAEFGIDSGGSADISICNNIVQQCSVGINAGGSIRVLVAYNRLLRNLRAITIFQVESDGQGRNFGIPCADIWIDANFIQVESNCGGIFLHDGPQRVRVERNRLTSSASELSKLLWAHTDSASLNCNTWNGGADVAADAKIVNGLCGLIVPDTVDYVTIPPSVSNVDVVLGSHQAEMIGKLSFIQVVNGGVDYTQASVIIGGNGSGAAAICYVHDGVIIGVAVTSTGDGYDTETATVRIAGDGHGAIARPIVGVPFAQNRRLTLQCSSAVSFSDNKSGMQTNWTQASIAVPANSEIILASSSVGWRAVQFFSQTNLTVASDGSVLVRSTGGNVSLRTGSGGGVQVCSDDEPFGFISCVGRGSPEGVVTATPGSDYRNLDGGAGKTLWLKITGTSKTGWSVVA